MMCRPLSVHVLCHCVTRGTFATQEVGVVNQGGVGNGGGSVGEAEGDSPS
jgi:hypothetical protein